MNSDDQPELRNITFWSVKQERLPKQVLTPHPLLCHTPKGADVAAVGRGRAAEPAARLQQRGGGEGAVPHTRGQSAGRLRSFHNNSFILFFLHWDTRKINTRCFCFHKKIKFRKCVDPQG